MQVKARGPRINASKSDAPPMISVIISAHNEAKYISAAVKSILHQTLGDFELITIDDGSTDETSKILENFSDPRIQMIRNEENIGLIRSLNRGLTLARGEFIARMDADDIALPDRFEKQVNFLKTHPNIGLLGTRIETFGIRRELWWAECEPARLKCRLLFEAGLFHNTIVFRRALMSEYQLFYDPAYPHAEDYALWTRFAEVTEVANLQDITVQYRLHNESVTHSHRDTLRNSADRIRLAQLAKLGLRPNDRQLEIHSSLLRGSPHTKKFGVDEVESWMIALIEGNKDERYPHAEFIELLYETWFKLCRSHRDQLRSPWYRFLFSPLARNMPWPNRIVDALRLWLLPKK